MGIFTKVSGQDRAQFANNLSVMLKSGIPIDQSLLTLADQANSSYLKKAITSVSDDVKNGTLLSVAFAKEEKAFGAIFVSLIAAGEESGTLRENLSFLADWFERSADLTREVKGAILYPKLVLSASLLLGGALSVFILPRLIPLFSQLDVELPLITRALMAASVFLQTKWIWCVLVCIGAFFLFRVLNRLATVRRLLDRVQLFLPFIGPILVQYQLALITQLFATLLHSGLPITRAIGVVEEAISNTYFKESIEAMERNVVAGRVLSEALIAYPKLYPKMCIGIVSVGEQSGALADSFSYLSQYYTKQVKSKAKQLPTIIEPLLLVFIAMIVGLVALAIVLPIYKLTGSIN